MAMESVNCNLCGSSQQSPLYNFFLNRDGCDCWLVRCSQCKLVYLTPRPIKQDIGGYFPPAYQADMLRLLAERQRNRIARWGFDMVRRRRTPAFRENGRLLDIGCSNGAYLAALREEGWNVEGIEMDPMAGSYARDVRGLTISIGDAELLLDELPASSFDVVTMWHVLHLFFDPSAALRKIQRLLKPDGVLLLELPNHAAPFASLFRKYWFPLDVPRHPYQFTPETLRIILSRAGLNLVRVNGVPAPEALVWSLSVLRRGVPVDFDNGPALHFNPAAMALAFPLSWAMARFGLSDHMAATAVRLN